MQQVNGPQPMPGYDPAPTRIEYKVSRLWFTPLLRGLLRTGLPAFLMMFLILAYASNTQDLDSLRASVLSAGSAAATRPELTVRHLEVVSASEPLKAEIAARFGDRLPGNALDLDLEDIRADLRSMPAVKDAVVRITPGAALSVRVDEAVPVALWRTREGLSVLDANGVRLRGVARRADYADLPVLAGNGAEARVAEALTLLAEASPLQGVLRGLVRVGERRWDMLLSRDRRIALPEKDPVSALRQILVLSQTRDLLDRDVLLIDFRDPTRPTVRLSVGAMDTLRTLKPAIIQGVIQ